MSVSSVRPCEVECEIHVLSFVLLGSYIAAFSYKFVNNTTNSIQYQLLNNLIPLHCFKGYRTCLNRPSSTSSGIRARF